MTTKEKIVQVEMTETEWLEIRLAIIDRADIIADTKMDTNTQQKWIADLLNMYDNIRRAIDMA